MMPHVQLKKKRKKIKKEKIEKRKKKREKKKNISSGKILIYWLVKFVNGL
jgi:hypothetical protein